MKIYKLKIYRVILIFLLAIPLNLSPISRVEGKSPAVSKKQGISYKKNFYRDLARRRSNNRADYPNLTDIEFANFRAVETTGIGKGKLYRSSSPVNSWGNRDIIADKTAENAGIKTFINLADTEAKLYGYKNFSNSYYSNQKIILLKLDWKYQSEQFQKRLAKGLSLMAKAQPPFLIHCDVGKDRTGFVCAILECLMGASTEEVTRDYLTSFYNYFGIKPDTKDYNFIADNEIRASLALAFNVKSIKNINLPAAAEKYLLRIGVAKDDITELKQKLGKN